MDLSLDFSKIISETHGVMSLALVFIASLIGSLHCAGMCGPLAVCATQKSPLRAFLYHFGRLLGYLAVGALFGLIGKNLLDGNFKYVNMVSTVFVSFVFFLFAYQLIFKGGIKTKLPEVFNKLLSKLMFFTRENTNVFSFSMGLFTPLLPCGWFYGFALVAMSSSSPTRGALLMLTFWLGTVPILVVVSEAAKFGLGRLQPKLRAITGVLFFCLGVFTLMNKYEHLSHMMGSGHEGHKMEVEQKNMHDQHKHHGHH